MASRARLGSLGLTEWFELGDGIVVTDDLANGAVTAEKISNVFTANIAESGNPTTGNVYFTNTRAVQAFTAGNGIILSSNGLIQADLSNADVIVLLGTQVSTQIVIAQNVIASTNVYAPGDVTLGNVNITGRFNFAGIGGFDLTNANLIQSNTLIVDDITLLGNLTGNLNLSTDDVTEGAANLYFTNARVGSFIRDSITTSNIAEGANLYFTNARAIGSLTAGSGIVIESNGVISAEVEASPTFEDLTITGNLTVQGNLTYLNVESLEIEDNMIFLNANSSTTNPDLGWAGNYNDGTYKHAGVFRDATDGVFKFFDGYLPELSGNAFIDTANASFRLANVQATTFIGNVTGQVSDISNHDTDALAEGANLYFTNARAIGSLTAGSGIVIESNGVISSQAEASPVFDDIVANTITTPVFNIEDSAGNVIGRVTEGDSNDVMLQSFAGHDIYMYPSNGTGTVFVEGNLQVNGIATFTLTTDSVIEGSNLYFTNARSLANISQTSINVHSDVNIDYANISISDILSWSGTHWVSGNLIAQVRGTIVDNLSTSNVIEGSNLYYTNARVDAYITDNIRTSNIGEDGNTTLGNVYFSNSRAVQAFTAGDGLVIESNGLVLVTATGVATIVASELYAGNGSNTDFMVGSTVEQADDIIVFINGLAQIPDVDYTVDPGNNLITFTTAPVNQSNVEVRFFGSGDALIDARGYFSQSINGAVGYAVTSLTAPALTVPLNLRYILHSIYVTNIDESLSGNVGITATLDQHNGGSPAVNTNVYIANVLPVDHRMSVELLKKPQILNAGDKVSLRAFKDGAGANSNIHAYLVYEAKSDIRYFGRGRNIGDLDNHIIFDTGGDPSTIENVRLANYGGSAAAATVQWVDSSNVTQAYFCYNFVVPPNTTVELLENPKVLPPDGRIMATASAPNAIAVSVSGRKH